MIAIVNKVKTDYSFTLYLKYLKLFIFKCLTRHVILKIEFSWIERQIFD